MQFTKNAKGFTLIELLVVITIIGILAVGGTTVYTSQIQKARDTTRITDIEALKNGIEQVYQDKGSYPEMSASGTTTTPGFKIVNDYNPTFGKDPKSGQSCAWDATSGTPCDYYYMVAQDSNGIINQTYNVSTGFENKGNITKATGDGGINNLRLEFGILSADNNTRFTTIPTAASKTTGVVSAAVTCTPEFGMLVIKGSVCP